MRPAVRTLFIVTFTLIAVVWAGGDIALPWHPFSTYGFAATQTGTIMYADTDAVSRGLHAGDRVDVTRLTPRDRSTFGTFPLAPEGQTLQLLLSSGRTVTVQSHPYSRSLADNVTDIIAVLALWAYIIIAAALVLLRPTPATWAFYAFSYTFCFIGALVPEYLPAPVVIAAGILSAISIAISPAALISFGLRFPNTAPSGNARRFERTILLLVAPLCAAYGAGTYAAYVLAAVVSPLWTAQTYVSAIAALYVVGVGVLLSRYARASSADRNRLRWVVAALAVAFFPTLTTYVLPAADISGVPPLASNLVAAWQLVAPIALAYTILKHRLFDVRFVVSRALVYAVLTSLVVGLLALADWAFGVWLAQSRFALVAEVALALLLGATLTTVHKRIERFLNGVVFRAQMLALQALRRFAQETDLIPDPEHLLAQAYEVLRGRLESDYVAIYAAEGSSYALATPGSESVPALLAGHDLAVLRLKRWHEPFECDEPGHALRGALMLPMTARAQLVGFIVCGPKHDHTHYLPEEVDTLSLLTHRTGSAYALLTMAAATAVPVTP